jgi:tripartite-type tricarboxylate transporter receptor subunit TctC
MRPHSRNPSVRCRRWGRDATAAATCVAAVLALASPAPAQSGSNFPSKPVRIIVPYGPGGVGDLTMRLLAQKLGERTRRSFVIENRPGAGGSLSAKGVLESPADGYTLGVTGNGQAISMTLFKARTYDVLTDFTQVSVTAQFEMLLAVKGDSPLKSLRDVVEAASKTPGKLNLGAINPGSTQNLSAHLFKQITGADVTIVPYRTTPDLVTAILRGDVDVGFDFFAGFQSVISDNKVRIIATSGEQRNPLLKEVPTAKESGFPDYVVTSWNGLATAAGLPDDVLKILNQHINLALAEPDLQEKAVKLGMDARGSTPEEMRERMARDIVRWRDVIEKAGIPKQ